MRVWFYILGLIAGFLFGHWFMAPSFYPMSGWVTEIDRGSDTVVFEETNGNIWEFRGAEDYEVGDLISCIMSDNGTSDVRDDVVLKVRFCG